MDHLHLLVPRRMGRLFKIQGTADGNAEHQNALLFAPGHQSFEHLIGIHAGDCRHVLTTQITFVIFVLHRPIGDLCRIHQAHGVGFIRLVHGFTLLFDLRPIL